METMGRNKVTKSSLKDLQAWDLTDNITDLEKLQHKLQQTV